MTFTCFYGHHEKIKTKIRNVYISLLRNEIEFWSLMKIVCIYFVEMHKERFAEEKNSVTVEKTLKEKYIKMFRGRVLNTDFYISEG